MTARDVASDLAGVGADGQWLHGKCTALSAPTCTVAFPTAPGQPADVVAGLHYIVAPAVNDPVLVLARSGGRLVIGPISH